LSEKNKRALSEIFNKRSVGRFVSLLCENRHRQQQNGCDDTDTPHAVNCSIVSLSVKISGSSISGRVTAKPYLLLSTLGGLDVSERTKAVNLQFEDKLVRIEWLNAAGESDGA
jgi:hypothetical protein